jgi:hypothetical protein
MRQVAVRHERPVGFHALQRARHDEQPPVGQPVERERERGHAHDDLTVARLVDSDHLAGTPVREPEAAVVPTSRLTEHDIPQQYSRFVQQDLLRSRQVRAE